EWLQAGVALGAAKTGSRAVGGVLRRNPAVLVAAAVGIGAAWYTVHRYRRKQQANGDGQVIEGKARRVEARRASRKGDAPSGDGTSVRRRASRARQATADTPAGNEGHRAWAGPRRPGLSPKPRRRPPRAVPARSARRRPRGPRSAVRRPPRPRSGAPATARARSTPRRSPRRWG